MRAFEHLSKAFLKTHPKESAWYIQSLTNEEALEALHLLEPVARARALEHLSPEKVNTLVEEMAEEVVVETLVGSAAGTCAAILQHVKNPKRDSLLNALPPAAAESIRDLLEQSQSTLAPLLQTRSLRVSPDTAVSQVLDLIKKSVVENQTTLFVLNENRQLVGTLHLKDLLAGGKRSKVGDCMNSSPIKVTLSESKENLIEFIKSREVTDLPVVDEENVFRGFIPFSVWLEEVTRQLASYEKRNQTGDTLIALGEVLWIGTSAILDTLAAFSKTDEESIQKKGD